MNDSKISLEEIKSKLYEFIDSCDKYSFYTRSTEVQYEKILECENHIKIIKQYKLQAINRNDESAANQLFHVQCIVNALRSFLIMYTEIKKGKFKEAWTALMDAQDYNNIALNINRREGDENLKSRLKAAETSLFPGWNIFNSPGFVETIGNCSICSSSFIDCEHLENEIYMGSLCQRVDRNIIEIDHFAFVKNPRDRRCIVTKISDTDGNEIDYFTWEKTGKIVENDDGLHIECILFSIPVLDIF